MSVYFGILRFKNEFFEEFSHAVRNKTDENTRDETYYGVLKYRCDGACRFCGKPGDVIYKSHKQSESERRFQVAYLRYNKRGKYHQSKSDRSETYGYETENHGKSRHKRKNGYVFRTEFFHGNFFHNAPF